MTQRTCEDCRWWERQYQSDRYGYCHRNPPEQGPLAWVRPEVEAAATCGEWADGSITPEQEERRELVRQFAVAIAHGDNATCNPEFVWAWAQKYADAEPK